MVRIEFVVPAVPVAQPRVKSTAIGGKARMYTPTKIGKGDNRRDHPIAAFKASVRHAASLAYNGAPIRGPVRVDLEFVFPRQANRIWKSKPMPRYRHTTKPDRDNLDKAVLDSLSKWMLEDDRQVCSGSIEKWHAAGDEQPHVRVTIETLD